MAMRSLILRTRESVLVSSMSNGDRMAMRYNVLLANAMPPLFGHIIKTSAVHLQHRLSSSPICCCLLSLHPH